MVSNALINMNTGRNSKQINNLFTAETKCSLKTYKGHMY